MSDEDPDAISVRFTTRTAAERAVEHLVQQLGIDRSSVQITPEGEQNSSGTTRSGGDLEPHARDDSPLEAPLRVRISGDTPDAKQARQTLRDLANEV